MPIDATYTLTERQERKTLPAYSVHLDLARGLAALAVFFGHLRLAVTGHTGLGQEAKMHTADTTVLTGIGHSAVVVFFVLSGYLVGGSVLRDLKRKRFSWKGYFLRRLTRLWTVLIPALLLGALWDTLSRHWFSGTSVYAADFARGLRQHHSAAIFFGNMSFLQYIPRLAIPTFGSNSALWSLSPEFWYYVLFPLLAMAVLGFVTSRIRAVVFFIFLVTILWFVGWPISSYFVFWLLGVAVYRIPAKIPEKTQRAAIAVLIFLLCAVLLWLRKHAVHEIAADALVAIAFTILLYALLHRTRNMPYSVYSHVARGLSLPSYTLYAVHLPLVIFSACAMEAWTPVLFSHKTAAMIVVALVVTVYVVALYWLFERNTDHIRRAIEGVLA